MVPDKFIEWSVTCLGPFHALLSPLLSCFGAVIGFRCAVSTIFLKVS